MKSMTGYGRGEAQNGSKSFLVEIKSINHRYNDIVVKLPKYLGCFEELIKKQIKEKINRGRVEAYISLEYNSDEDVEIKVNLPLAKSYREASFKIAQELDLETGISIETVIGFPDVLKAEKKEVDQDELWVGLSVALNNALESLLEMRLEEGTELQTDIFLKIKNIEKMLEEIEERAPRIVIEYREKLSQRIEELLDKKYELDESRLANEVAYFADKAGIDEEIVRLKSHISQIQIALKAEGTVGRKLDFIIQEMNREINTIGSKSGDIEITNNVVDIKTEIEKIREQAQNIE